MNFLSQGLRKLSSNRHTDRQVTPGHFQSRDKNGGHTIRSAVFKFQKPHATYKPDGSFDLDLGPMTFKCKIYPYCLEIHWICKYELPMPRLSKIIV